MSNNLTDSNNNTGNLTAIKPPDTDIAAVGTESLNANPNDRSELVASTRDSDPATAGDAIDDAGVVNLSALRSLEDAQDDGDSDLVVELIDLYLEDALGRVQSIADAIANRDMELLKRSAHILKGSSGSLGVIHLVSICEKLEAEANHDSSHAATLLGSLEREFSRVREVLLVEREARAR